ncbi:MAG: Gfo/Idh/MocA family oxidoreductase [Microthrixaceae bacterium]
MSNRRFGRGLRRSQTKVALAGAGYVAVVHSLAAQSAGMKVTAVASKGGTSARHLAGQLDARKVAVDALPAGADVLIVATPPDGHLALALAGLEAGATVLVEKPFTSTLAEADTLIAALDNIPGPRQGENRAERATPADSGRRLMCAENLLHSPLWVKAMELLPSLGPLGHLSLQTVQPPPDWGHFTEPLKNGGVLFDLGPHPIAMALGLAGANPIGVSAELSSGRPDGADDRAELKLRFASGLVAELAVSWTAQDPYWGVQAASDSGVLRIELVPELSLEFNGDAVAIPHRHQPPDPRIESMGYVDQLLDLVSDEDHGRGQSAGAARDVLEVIYAGYASAGAAGTEVSLPFTGDRTALPISHWRS